MKVSKYPKAISNTWPTPPMRAAGLVRWIAIFTAVISTIGALIGRQAEEIANSAILLKNEAALKKTEAADQWNYYQAVSTKGHLAELAMSLVPTDQRPPFADKIKKYEAQKTDIRRQADKLEALSAKANAESAAHCRARVAISCTHWHCCRSRLASSRSRY